jgi:PAS domain S-box-containing protein
VTYPRLRLVARCSTFSRRGGCRIGLLACGIAAVSWAALAGAAPSPRPRQTAPLSFRHLGVEDGLSASWVRGTLEDHRGFLWIATSDGLDRYDGQAFVRYSHVPGDPHSLGRAEVAALFEDHAHRLWVGAGGLFLYDRDHERFDERHLWPPEQAGSAAQTVRAIAEDPEGNLWVATSMGLVRYRPETGAVTHFRARPHDPQSLSLDAVFCLAFDGQGTLWVGTWRGLDRFDARTQSFEHVVLPRSGPSPSSGRGPRPRLVSALWPSASGGVWVAVAGTGLLRYDAAGGLLAEYYPEPGEAASIASASILSLAGDGDRTLYVGHDNAGLDVLDVASGTFTHNVTDPEDPTALSSPSVWSLRLDEHGILWVGTFNGGLDQVLPWGQQFGLVRARRDGLTNPHVTALEAHHRTLWIGTDGGGLHRFDRSSGRWRVYRRKPQLPSGLPSDAVISVHVDRGGIVWIGTWLGGLNRLDPQTDRMVYFPVRPLGRPGLHTFSIRSIIEDRQGRLLLGTESGGVSTYDPRSGRFGRLSDLYPTATEVGTVRALLEDTHGNLWVGHGADVRNQGFDGVERFAASDGAMTRYVAATDATQMKGLAPGAVFALREDRSGNVWVGSRGGLSCIAAGTGTIKRYGVADGLPSDVVTGIADEPSGNLWVGTTRGLALMFGASSLPAKPRVLVFDRRDGLQGLDFTPGATFQSPDGEVFFGGQHGITFFALGSIHLNLEAPPVVLTALRLFNEPVPIAQPGSPLTKSITETDALTLAHDQTVVAFDFAALNYVLPQKNRYAYRLEGLDPGWNAVGNRATAAYTNLEPGSYVFRVRASNNDGVWNDRGVALRLTITPPWWQRGLVRAAALCLVAGVVFSMHRLRVRRIRRQNARLAEQVEERTRDLNALNATLGSLNSQLEDRVAERTTELEAEKERLAVTLRSIGDGVIATDVEGRIVLINRVAEQITGWASAEARGHSLGNVMPLLDRVSREPLPDPVAAVLDRGAVLDVPAGATLVRKDGNELLIADSAAPIRDRQSRIVGAVLVFRDVTERRRVEEQLQNAQKLESLGILAGGIAHDFNNLLTGVFGLVDLARHRSAPDTPIRKTLDRTLAVLDRARGLTGQLLTFSQAGEPVTVPLALEPLLESCSQFALSGSNVSCELDLAPDLWPCEGDERQLDQVVDNVLLNARQAMPQGGTVHVRAENVLVPDDVQVPVEPGRYVRVTVRDTGPGIPPELRSRIFEPFFTTKASGSGLGLATSYSIIRKHRGHIEVLSEPGNGAAFSVYLPASTAPPASRIESVAEVPMGTGRILVVDDESYVLEVASEMLESLGYTVTTVPDGEAAVGACQRALAEGAPFDAAILDLTIPGGLGGVAAVPLLRRLDAHLPMIATSGYTGDRVMADPQAYGFAATLGKPFTLADLAVVVARVLEGWGRL